MSKTGPSPKVVKASRPPLALRQKWMSGTICFILNHLATDPCFEAVNDMNFTGERKPWQKEISSRETPNNIVTWTLAPVFQRLADYRMTFQSRRFACPSIHNAP